MVFGTGQVSLTQAPSLQNYPVLVHYFRKSNGTPTLVRSKRARRHTRQDSDPEADTEGSTTTLDDVTHSVVTDGTILPECVGRRRLLF